MNLAAAHGSHHENPHVHSKTCNPFWLATTQGNSVYANQPWNASHLGKIRKMAHESERAISKHEPFDFKP
jgi:hypothetical protein